MPGTGDTDVDPARLLASLAAEAGVAVSAAERDALLRYADLLLAWGKRINLTGARSVATLVAQHYPDAFALASRLDQPGRVVDVGSGGGLPALPLALLRPALRIQLLEPIAKKGAFLRTAIRELGLADRLTLDGRRVEQLLATPFDPFDAAMSRATFDPESWLPLGRRLVRPGGRVFLLTVPGATPHAPQLTYADGRRTLVEVLV
jgi:16S rRNA (guanine527-N7)-methyltransferase